MKRPAFQFYPGDWLHDAALRTVSVAARGLWIDMLCFMHQADPYGHLMVNNKVISEDNLARVVGSPVRTVKSLLRELEGAGIFSRSPDNLAIFSRRMVRDEAIRTRRAEGGVLGGNPALLKAQKQTEKDNQKVNHEDNLATEIRTPPSSSSSSSSSYTRVPDESDTGAKVEDEPEKKPAKLRQRNPLHDALASINGANPLEVPRTAARTIGVALAEIKAVTPDLTPEEIHRRAARYKKLHPTWTLTPKALANNWAECGPTLNTQQPLPLANLPDTENHA
jgi:hypothetical protein